MCVFSWEAAPPPLCAGASPDDAWVGLWRRCRPGPGLPVLGLLPSPIPCNPVSFPTLGAPMSHKGQPGEPTAAQQARKDSWARWQRGSLLGEGRGGAGGLTWAIPNSPSSRQPFQGAQRDTSPLARPSERPGGAESACGCFKAGAWRRDQVINGETREFQGDMSSAVLCTRCVGGRAMSACAGIHTVWVHWGAVWPCVIGGHPGSACLWLCMSERPTGARRSQPGRAPPFTPG